MEEASKAGRVAGMLRNLLALALATVAVWRARAAHRRALERLDAHILKDFGLSEGRLKRVLRKWFWQP